VTRVAVQRLRGGEFDAPSRAPLELHRRLLGYEPTPLRDASRLAARLRVARVWVKDESSRLGLPSFKILGASWATYRALEQQLGGLGPWESVPDLRARLATRGPLGLVAATDGNHGRAVARMAHLLGLESRIFVPSGTATARIEDIRKEGARCDVVAGTYDDAVARAAEEASERCLVISDTSWPGYEDVPRWVIEGYATIFWEIDDELARRAQPPPTLVVVQIGVGALAAAAARHYRRADGDVAADMVGVEPVRAACVLASVEAGAITTIPGPHDSIMSGLNCGTPSLVAWPIVSRAYDLYMAIEDERARAGMRALAEEGIVAGETGAAGIGALLELAHSGAAPVALDGSTRVLVLNTEGATDPEAYEHIVGRPPNCILNAVTHAQRG
jgi:diaminopropionate ammonia-lyase